MPFRSQGSIVYELHLGFLPHAALSRWAVRGRRDPLSTVAATRVWALYSKSRTWHPNSTEINHTMTTNFFVATPGRKNLLVGQSHEVYATFTFNTPAMDEAKRAPLDIAVAMDVSGSMHGDKIENAQRSLLKLVEHLRATDRLTIVTFTGHVETVVEPMLMTAGNKGKAQDAINRMRALSSTNLSGGLFQALDHLKNAKPIPGSVRRCMVFTDGMANGGIIDPDRLAVAALEYREGIGISSFGYGSRLDEKLLEGISQDGDFYAIDTPDKILTAFGTELGGLISTYAQNVRMALTPAKGVKILEVLNDLTVKEKDDGSVMVECDDLLAEQEYTVVVKLQLDKRDKTFPRGITLVKAKVGYVDMTTTKHKTVEASLKAKFVVAGKEDKEPSKTVLEEVALQNIVKAQAEAIRMADAGDLRGAQQVLYLSAAMSHDLGTEKSIGYSNLVRGLADDNFGSEQRYRMGGSSEARHVKKAVKRRRKVGKNVKGAENFGTRAQSSMADDFEGKGPTKQDLLDRLGAAKAVPDPARPITSELGPEAAPPQTSSSGPGKSRSSSSW